MSVCSDRATSERHCNTDQSGHSKGDMAPGGGCSVVPSHHPGHWWTNESTVCVQRLRHRVGCSWRPPMFHLSDISVLIQQFPDAERAHRLHVHHQQWVGRAKQISITWWLGSRSAILSEAFLSDMQNMILRGKRIQMPWQPTCCRVCHENINRRKYRNSILTMGYTVNQYASCAYQRWKKINYFTQKQVFSQDQQKNGPWMIGYETKVQLTITPSVSLTRHFLISEIYICLCQATAFNFLDERFLIYNKTKNNVL